MSAVPQDSSTEGVSGMPGIRKARHGSSFEDFKFCTETCLRPARDSNPGIRRVSCRAEIDTSPPFESVREAVIRFGGSGPWVPFYKFGEKMEEAAMAAEALAHVELLNALVGAKGLSSNETSSEPQQSPRTEFDEQNNVFELIILRKLEQASEEIKHYKKALKEALKSVEIASKKQLDIEEALEKWIPKHEHNKHVVYNGSKINNHPRSPLKDLMKKQKQDIYDDPNHVSRPRECLDRIETKKVASSRMVDEQKQDLRHHGDVPKQLFTQRRKFGFIHIHWQSKAKKKPQALNTM